jgi:hypothetical protein
MFTHEFVFEGGTIKIRETATEKDIVVQPGRPGQEGLIPWENEEQALAWAENIYGYLLHNEVIEISSEEPIVEESAGEITDGDEGTGE